MPPGKVATDLLARCSTAIDVPPDGQPLPVVVTFEPTGTGFGATCSMDVEAP